MRRGGRRRKIPKIDIFAGASRARDPTVRTWQNKCRRRPTIAFFDVCFSISVCAKLWIGNETMNPTTRMNELNVMWP